MNAPRKTAYAWVICCAAAAMVWEGCSSTYRVADVVLDPMINLHPVYQPPPSGPAKLTGGNGWTRQNAVVVRNCANEGEVTALEESYVALYFHNVVTREVVTEREGGRLFHVHRLRAVLGTRETSREVHFDVTNAVRRPGLLHGGSGRTGSR